MSSIVIAGDTSGSVTLQAPAVAGTVTLTLPATSGTIALVGGSGSSQWTTSGSDIYYTTGKVGIGTATPASTLQVANTYTNTSDATIVASGTIPGINIRPAVGRFSILSSYASGDTTSFVVGTGTSNPSSEVIRLDHTASTTTFTNTIGVGGATASTSGAGITFPAAQQASSNANTLDDYEEGTWTPGIEFSVSNATLTIAGDTKGSYVKIGKMVNVIGLVRFSETSASGDVEINGLPFAAVSTSGLFAGGAVYADKLTGVSGQIQFLIGGGVSSNKIFPYYSGTGTRTRITNANTGTDTDFAFAICYQVA